MIGFVSFALWFGGIIPAYRHSRNNGHSKFGAALDAIIWPMDVGWVLADKYCKEHKE